MAKYDTGRVWAYLASALGVGVSLAANVEAITIRGNVVPGEVLAAVWSPIALLVALEVNARFDWGTDRLPTTLRWLGLTPLTVIAAAVSYSHMRSLLAAYHQDVFSQWFLPLSVDGLMVISQAALVLHPRQVPVTSPVTEAVDASVSPQSPETPAPTPEPSRTRREAPSTPQRVSKALPRTAPAEDPVEAVKRANVAPTISNIRTTAKVGTARAQKIRRTLLAEGWVPAEDRVTAPDALALDDRSRVWGIDHGAASQEQPDMVGVPA